MVSLNGIDISSYQGGINISFLNDIDFVCVKATQGNWYVNPYFYQQADNVLKANKILGVYHYSECKVAPQVEAEFFLKETKQYAGNCFYMLDHESIINPSWAYEFLEDVSRETKVSPFIYLSLNSENNYNFSLVAKKFPLWLAAYAYSSTTLQDNPILIGNTRYWKEISMYQYTSVGKVSGYDGALDLNKFYGDKKALSSFIGSNVVSSSFVPSSYVDKLGVKWIYEKGTATLINNVNLRWGANTRSQIIMTLPVGSIVKYDAKAVADGYIWVRQPRSGTSFGYLAVGKADQNGNNIEPYATFK